MTAPLRVLSLGAGVQSTCVLAMALEGHIEPIQHAIFADTGDEPAAVYENLDYLRHRCDEGGVQLHVVGKNNSASLSQDMAEVAAGTRRRADQPPLFVQTYEDVPVAWEPCPACGGRTGLLARAVDGRELGVECPECEGGGVRAVRWEQRPTRGQIRRRCTKGHKIEPVERRMKHLAGMFGKPATDAHLVTQLFGISWDETQRMRDPVLPWVRYSYPLVDQRMTRQGCLDWLAERDWPPPARSACVFCPYRHNDEWRSLRDNDPEGWARAVAFDELVRDGSPYGMDGALFVHASLVPLAEADLGEAAGDPRLDLWGTDAECEGMCGV